MQQLRIAGLPEDPLAAAAAFHAEWLPRVSDLARSAVPLPLAGGARGGPVLPNATQTDTDPPPAPPASGSGDDLVLIFHSADHTHRAWRLAAVQGLARQHTPRRINAVEAEGEAAIASACAYLAAAPGLTGQLLSLADAGAGSVLD